MPRKNLDRSLLIIDGSNLAHRAYHKFANMRYEGQKTGMIYGFLRLLQQYAIRFRCKYIIVTFDTKQSKSSNFRNELLGSYKIHRKDNLRIDFEDFNQQTHYLVQKQPVEFEDYIYLGIEVKELQLDDVEEANLEYEDLLTAE